MIQKNKEKKMNTAGFTLIELIIVIAILGILAAVVIPRLSVFRISAANRVDEANASILTDIAHTIQAETGSFPSESDWGQSFTTFQSNKTTYLDKDIEILNKDNTFEYSDVTGVVTVYRQDENTPPVVVPPPSGSTLQNIINSATLSFSNSATSLNPVIILPSEAGVTYVLTTGSSKGNASISVGGDGTTATVKRPPGGIRYLTLTIKATQGGETVTRTFNVTVPKTGAVIVQ